MAGGMDLKKHGIYFTGIHRLHASKNRCQAEKLTAKVSLYIIPQ